MSSNTLLTIFSLRDRFAIKSKMFIMTKIHLSFYSINDCEYANIKIVNFNKYVKYIENYKVYIPYTYNSSNCLNYY